MKEELVINGSIYGGVRKRLFKMKQEKLFFIICLPVFFSLYFVMITLNIHNFLSKIFNNFNLGFTINKEFIGTILMFIMILSVVKIINKYILPSATYIEKIDRNKLKSFNPLIITKDTLTYMVYRSKIEDILYNTKGLDKDTEEFLIALYPQTFQNLRKPNIETIEIYLEDKNRKKIGKLFKKENNYINKLFHPKLDFNSYTKNEIDRIFFTLNKFLDKDMNDFKMEVLKSYSFEEKLYYLNKFKRIKEK